MIDRKRLTAIGDLNLTGKIEKMSDFEVNDYCKTLDAFVEGFPSLETDIKRHLSAKNHNAFTISVLKARDMLEKINAFDLAQNCVKLINDIRTSRFEVVEAYLTYFLTAVSALSIEIQMAQHEDMAPKEPAAVKAAEPAVKEEAPEAPPKPKSILAVDDISLTLNALRIALQQTNYKFTGVTSGAAALRFIREHTPDLFILDIEMPEMNGYELARKVRAGGMSAPIIFLTGNAKREYVLKAIEAGAADFIVKPVNPDSMIEKINKFIR